MGELLDALSSLNNDTPPSQGGELFNALQDLRQSDATGNMLQAQGANPDVAARAKTVADRLGVPQPVVEADLPNFEQQLQIRQNREITAQNPALQNFAADNPLAVRMAQDDFDNLDIVSKLTKSLESGNQRALLEDELGWINTRKMLKAPLAEDAQREADIQQQLQTQPQYSGVWGYLQKATSFGRGLEKSAERAVPPAVAAAGVGAAATPEFGGAGAVPMFVGTFTTGLAADFARSSAANTYAALDKVRDDTGQPISEPAKYLGAGISGAITYFVGKAGGEQVSATTLAGVDALVNRTLADAMQRPTVSRGFGQIAKTITESGLKGAALNGMMTLANTAGEQAARFITPNISTILTDPAQQAQFQEQLVNSMVEGAELFPLMEIPGAGMRFIGDGLRARQAQIDAQALTDLAGGVTESKTRNRSLQTFIDFMKDQTQGTSIENMHVDVNALMTLYQKAGIADPLKLDPKDDPLLGWLSDRDQQIQEALARKGDIVIPSADFVSRLGGTDAFNELLPDVRVRPDGMTLREASDAPALLARTREFMEAAQKLSDNFAKGQAEDEPMQRVYNDVYPQAAKAGYEPKAADTYARIMAAQAAATAEREPGIYGDAWEAYQSGMLRVQGASESGMASGLNQAAMYRSPKADAAQFVAHVLENPDTKRSYFEYGPVPDNVAARAKEETGRDISNASVILPSDIVNHVKNRHPDISPEQWSDLGKEINKAHEIFPADPGRISYGGTSLAFVSYHDGRGTAIVAEHVATKNGERLVIKTFFKDTEKAVRKWAEDVRAKQEKGLGAGGSPAYPSPAPEGGDVTPDTFSIKERIVPGDEEVNQNQGPGGSRASRAIPTSEMLGEIPLPLKDIQEYDDLQKEAARRAWADVEKEHGKQVRISEKQLRQQGETLYNELQSSQALETMRKAGLKRNSLDDRDQDDVSQLAGKYPGLISKKGQFGLDEIANMHGYESDDALFHDLLNSETKNEFLDRYVEDAKRDWGVQIGLTPEEWQRRLLEKENEVFSELTRSTPDARLDQIRKRMGHAPVGWGEVEGGMQGQAAREPKASLRLPPGGFGTGPHVMNIFAAKDRSSFLHEAGHLFLEQLIFNAHHLAASEQGKADLQTLKDWWASHNEELHSQFQKAKKDAEAALRANPEDPQVQARAAAYRNAAALLGNDIKSGPAYFREFAQHLGTGIDDPSVRMALMTPLHELFARTFEGYLMEGKAPSPGLQRVFDSLRTWLKSIYERVAGRGRAMFGLSQVAGTRIEVSPEVRGVMDRLLATDEEIETMRQQQRLGRLFKSAEDAGMTSAEWKAYNNLVAKSISEARAQVQTKAMRQFAKEKSDEWAAKADELRPEVEKQVNGRSDLQALHYLRTGKLLGAEDQPENPARAYLDQKTLEGLIGKDNLKNLPFGIYAKKGGIDPQELGEMFGYRSGTDLARDMLSLEVQRRDLANRGINAGPREHLIQEALTARLKDHFGDMMSDGSMPAEAMGAVHNDQALQALGMELRALIRQTGQQRPVLGPAADARGWARDTIGDRKVSEVTNLNRYARDEARAAAAAEKAMLKGDLQEAIAQKRSQILNHALYVEAKKASESLEGLEDRADRYGKKRTIKSMDQGALDQIHTLLERFGLKRQDPNFENREVLSSWVGRIRGDGGDVKVADSLFNPTLPAHYRDLTVSQMRDLSDAVASIAHVGRDLHKITVQGKKADFEQTVADLARAAFTNVEKKAIPPERNPGVVQGAMGERAQARLRNVGDLLGGFHSSLAKIEQELIDRLDGKDSNGPWNRVIWSRVKDARAYENKWREEMAGGVKELVNAYPKEEQDKLTEYLPPLIELRDNRTGQPTKITKGELISLALNWGNESNKSKMLKGEGWQEDAVQAVLDRHMTKADWDFVQGIWNLIERMRPEISAREQRMTGTEPIWIDPSTVHTPHGDYRGGYYPMMYDPARSGDVMDRLLENAQKMMDQSRAGRPTTDNGNMQARVAGYARPVMLSLDTLPRHIDTIIRDLAWRETVYDLTRLFKDPGIRDAIRLTVGDRMYGQLIPWLKRTIGDRAYDATGNDFWASLARKIRLNTTIVGLGYRASTMMVHGATAMSNSIGEIGLKWMATGMKEFYGNPAKMAEMRDFIFSRSDDMRYRMDTVDRDVRDGLRDLLDKQGMVPGIKRFAYYGISMLDMASAMPTWMGAYEKARALAADGGLGMGEKDAIYFADKAVRNAHGGGNPEDLAAFQHGNEWQKLAGMFYTFWNHFYNRQVDIGRSGIEAIQNRSVTDFAAVLARSWWYFVMPMILHGVIKGGGPEDEESWIGWAAKEIGLGLFSGIPVVRDIASAASTGRDYKPTPALSIIEAGKKTYKDIENLSRGEDVSPHWLRHSLETAGYVFGLPTGQAAQSLQYLWDVWSGEQDPEDVKGFMQGMVFGGTKKKGH